MAQGGKSLNDRILAAEVRTLSLRKIKSVLEDEKCEKYGKEFQQQLLLRLAGTLLPRLNEHTGEDGEQLFPQPLLGGKSNGRINIGNEEIIEVKKED